MRFVLRRLVFYVITAWAAITINFFLPRLMPGDPVSAVLARLHGRITPAATASLRAQFGLNTKSSLVAQYFHYWSRLLHGDMGVSINFYPTPVTHVIATALPWTLALVGVASVVSFVIGTLAGILVAWYRGGAVDAALPVMTFLSSVPYFWTGLVLLYIFGVVLGWLPIGQGYTQGLVPGWSASFVSSAVVHSLLPATTIVISSMAGWMIGMRNMMLTTMSEDYVMVAQAKGLSPRRVVMTYAARNAILPNLAGFALQLGFVVSGALIVEIAFSYPGIGYVLLLAIENSDYPLMQGIFLVITIGVLVANLCADLAYVALDPRTRQEA